MVVAVAYLQVGGEAQANHTFMKRKLHNNHSQPQTNI